MRWFVCFGLLSLSWVALTAPPAWAESYNFSSNPLVAGSPWSFGVGSNVNNQFTWTAGSGLNVAVNSSLPTARFDLPLGMSLTDTSSFELSARFSFHVTSAPGDQDMQFAFGLTNSITTGGDRTGTPTNFSSDNTFSTVEFNYFPNLTSFGGPSLTPTVFGAQEPASDAFSNFASIFGPTSNLGDHSQGLTSLPQDTQLEARLDYDGASKTATLTMFQIVGGSPVQLNLGSTPISLDLAAAGYDASHPFTLNELSIMTYQDGFTTPTEPSLIGSMTFSSIGVAVPEPSSVVLGSLAGLGFAL